MNSSTELSESFGRCAFGVARCAFCLAGCGGSTQMTSSPALLSQSITFAPISTQIAGTPLALTATASSGLPVSLASNTTSICTISSAQVSLIDAGTCTIQATQAGNATYAAATPVLQSFTVKFQSVCATPAATNPAVGSGTYQQITINPAVYGTGSTAGWTVFGFSQEADLLSSGDPQVLEMAPNVVPRAWARWDTGGVVASQYNFGYPTQAQTAGIVFIGGTTTTVLFGNEFPAPVAFNAVVSCNADGQPVVQPAPQGFYRGSLASPAFRQYIIGISEIQIDGGLDGLFFDEVGGSYDGLSFGNDNGFDDADVADFGGFLCAKYPNLTVAQWQTQFGIMAADNLNCSAAASTSGRTFDYRGYLARNGWDTNPLTSANPLAAEWGVTHDYHPLTQNGTFTNTYLYLVYWQDIVVTLRNYARQKYGKEIYITANGIFPFVDFQARGINDFNDDGPGGTDVDYCPLTASGDLMGTQSLMQAFLTTKQRSALVAGRVVPVSEFLDWPSGPMSRYLSLPASELQDYWRMYVPEALAVGVNLAMHLEDSIGDPTATQLGLMPYFEQTSAFYKAPAHAALYGNATNLSGTVTVSASNVATNLTRLVDGRTVAHLINHNYSKGFQTQSGVVVTFPVATAPVTVTLVSPDNSADTNVSFTYSNGQVQVTVPQLTAYVALVAQ